MTPSGIIQSVRDQLNEPEPGFYTDSELYSYLSQAELTFANAIQCTETSTTVVASGGYREFNKPESLNIYRVTWDNYPLIKISENDIDAIEGTSYGKIPSSGTPTYYYEHTNSIGLSPIPSEQKNLIYYYYEKPTVLTSASVDFTIPDRFSHYLVDYVMYRALFKDQDGRAGSYLQIWNDNLRKARTEYKKAVRTNKVTTVKDSSETYILTF